MSHADVAKILALPVEERLRLIRLIWESLSVNPSEIPVTDAERRLVDERMAEHALDPDDVISHADLLAMARRARR